MTRYQKTEHLGRWEVRDEKVTRITQRPGSRTCPDPWQHSPSQNPYPLHAFAGAAQQTHVLIFSSKASLLLDTFKTNTINLYWQIQWAVLMPCTVPLKSRQSIPNIDGISPSACWVQEQPETSFATRGCFLDTNSCCFLRTEREGENTSVTRSERHNLQHSCMNTTAIAEK